MNPELIKFLFSPLQEIQLDLTNMCNLRCPMCYISYFKFKKRGFLDYALFRKIINELFEINAYVEMIKLYWIGEPLLHPQFARMLEYIFFKKSKRNWFRHTMTSTNGLALDLSLIHI